MARTKRQKNVPFFKSEWKKTDNGFIYQIEANRFLRGMIRMIVGMCINVAKGQVSIAEVKKALDTQSRLGKDWSVPARGLFLSKIEYDYIRENRYVGDHC